MSFTGEIKASRDNYPIRPIVSFLDSPTYNLAQFLSKLLMRITERSNNKLTNSFKTKEFLENQIIPEDYLLVSFDVKSLFTCIPHSLALEAIENALNNDREIFERTFLGIEDILNLIKLCIKSATFKYKDIIYNQINGTPMGSPISVVIAELTMQFFENNALQNSPHPLLFWKRYVDDTLTCLHKNSINNFLSYINSINNNIKFTHEIENNNQISFLDLKIKRNQDNSLSFSVFRKETNTATYLNFKSNNPISHKKSVAYSLFNRSKLICNQEEKANEDKIIFEQLKENNYPTSVIKKCHQKINNNPDVTIERPPVKYVKAPYIKGPSEKISKILRPHSIVLANKPSNSLRASLCKVKDQLNILEKNSVVYKIPCSDCNNVYIGETRKELKFRLHEHQLNVEKNYLQSQIVQHTNSENHTMKWDDISVLGTHKNAKSRKVLESLHSNNNQNSFNRSINIHQSFINISNSYISN